MARFAFLALIATAVMAAQCSAPSDQEKADCEAKGGKWVQSYISKLGEQTSVWRCLEDVPDSDWGGGLGK